MSNHRRLSFSLLTIFCLAIVGVHAAAVRSQSLLPLVGVEGWNLSTDQGATMTQKVTKEKGAEALSLSFDFGEGKWVNAAKSVDFDFTRVEAHRFRIKVEGNVKSVELKIQDARGNVFGHSLRPGPLGEWEDIRLSSTAFTYWWGGENNMDFASVRTLALAVSVKDPAVADGGKVSLSRWDVDAPSDARLVRVLEGGWSKAQNFFRLTEKTGGALFVDPDGKPFYSVGMVYAYGPDRGAIVGRLNPDYVTKDLSLMKEHGFNTLNLYGREFLLDVLNWCEANKMAVYFRTAYTDAPGLSDREREFPDFMDTAFRKKTKDFFDPFLKTIRNYRCVLAVDMDQRWLFYPDWAGQRRLGDPHWGPETLKAFPLWLEKRFGDVSALNTAWGKDYDYFDDVIEDPSLVKEGEMLPLGENPWRLDVVEYTGWAINDFLKELTDHMRKRDPNHLITYTSELTEVTPFPLSTRENSGIDFISPVHYNFHDDFDSDPVANMRLLTHLKWYYDLTGMPQYISETGFRTDALAQTPPSLGYAMVPDRNRDSQAFLYVKQAALMNVYPWLTGWSYFKWYDKWLEGDFGLIENDRSPKPISLAAKAFNPRLPYNAGVEASPLFQIYYPSYAVGALRAGFPAFKSLIQLFEGRFLRSVDQMLDDAWATYEKKPSKLTGPLATDRMNSLFQKEWVPFRFTAELPAKGKVILAGNALESLSAPDRLSLKDRETVTLARVGIRDERLRPTDPWFLEVAGVQPPQLTEIVVPVDLSDFWKGGGSKSAPEDIRPNLPGGGLRCGKDGVEFRGAPADASRNHVVWEGQTISVVPGAYSRVHFLMGSVAGNRVARANLLYENGESESVILGPSIGDIAEAPPTYYHAAWEGPGRKNGREVSLHVGHLVVPTRIDKKLIGIRLSKDSDLRLYGLSLGQGGVSENILVTVNVGKTSITGRSEWVQYLRPTKTPGYRALATFANGMPAVIQSLDGRHTAFLYDALGWQGHPEEIRRKTAGQETLLWKVLTGEDR
jgi:hypothetical protein